MEQQRPSTAKNKYVKLWGKKIGTATVENSREISQQIKTSTTISFVHSLNGV